MIQKATKMCRNNEKQSIPFLKEKSTCERTVEQFPLVCSNTFYYYNIIINFYSSFSHKTVQLFVRFLFGHMSTLF